MTFTASLQQSGDFPTSAPLPSSEESSRRGEVFSRRNGDDPKQPRYIATVSRRGYRFSAASVAARLHSAADVERNSAGHAALAALTTMCRGDTALANPIRAVAATLEREQPVLNQF